jgi:glycosyltransferase involved in cell wall biosynthesis
MPPLENWVDPEGVPVRLWGGKWENPWRGYIYALGVAWTLFKERNNYEVAYFLMQGLQLATGVPMARLLGKKIVMKFSCSSLVQEMTKTRMGRIELGFLKRWADRILILNPGMVEEARDVGINLDRLGWMPNPVDTDTFHPCLPEERLRLRQALGVGTDTPLAVFVGRLDYQKELPWLLGAWARVIREIPTARLALVGDGPLREQIHQKARELGVYDHVIFTGRLQMDGLLKWLQAGDVFTLVSAVEGLPCSVIEAMSAGMPSVLSDIPAHAQLVDHGVHGLLTELSNEDAIARGLVEVLRDPEMRTRMGAAARQRMLEQYSTPIVVDCYEKLLAEVRATP